jgi:biopolymer transport protein ExbD
MTPMLDIVFIMLIFFIVTTSFLKESGININRPSSLTGPDIPKLITIKLNIDQNDGITIEDREIDFRAVDANIERIKAQDPSKMIVVVVDPSSSTDMMVKVVDAARNAGIDRVNVANKAVN